MNAMTEQAAVLVIGAAIGGGFFSGRIRVGEEVFGLVVAPKAEGEHKDTPWNKSLKRVEGALSYFDGRANTIAMAEAGSKLAKWALGLKIDGHDDWYLPSVDELELIYRNLKPTTDENDCWMKSGINLSSVPPQYPYTPDSPKQTDVEAFRKGGAEAFDPVWHWTSTQYEPESDRAGAQDFTDGYQLYGTKDNNNRARAVRRIKL
jgi:hypothetical protein